MSFRLSARWSSVQLEPVSYAIHTEAELFWGVEGDLFWGVEGWPKPKILEQIDASTQELRTFAQCVNVLICSGCWDWATPQCSEEVQESEQLWQRCNVQIVPSKQTQHKGLDVLTGANAL